MLQHLRPALVMLALFTVLTGVIYPFALTGFAAIALPGTANGSLVKNGDVIVGSSLIGQNFTKDVYFHSRPSATSAADPNDSTKTIDAPYNADNSSGSNLGPTSAKLIDRVKADIETLRGQGLAGPIPADAVTTSGSGLDPDISPAYAKAQVARVAKARNLPEAKVAALVDATTSGRLLGVIGEPRVNVLELNLALDGMKGS
ncbi:potassium translocating ATPase, subunit C [Methylocella tundrae]|uniref:Potassium-transporting ATPase KdpC subunit n=1 Tax=Methylocella tundrae TaxID=227605 RepID=A0A8B6LZW6_METTU|nr:potassium-transporting ATPase subunit KdpC [Methylocella tundrae]VTZ28079.1 potassium translocating ATPase, subunit C [Methylocella tundrae]VTZ48054.1 potassium translocating ATPase, subunit C [Methylocella tundrae]